MAWQELNQCSIERGLSDEIFKKHRLACLLGAA